jgi:hypothetical protein
MAEEKRDDRSRRQRSDRVHLQFLKQAGASGVDPVKREQKSRQHREEDQACK